MSKYEYTMGKEVDLKAEQEKTLNVPVMKANFVLKMFYLTADLMYGFKRTLPKFKVIEILARYPYWAWENGSYHRMTRQYANARYTRKEDSEYAVRHIDMGRRSQDNEQHHLMLIEDLMRQKGMKQGWFRYYVVARLMSFGYLLMTRAIYRFRPEWTFAMNARFESHAEHEYMKMVAENPEWENEPVESEYFAYYPKQATMADLFRRIGLDERDHMMESMEEYERITGKELTQ